MDRTEFIAATAILLFGAFCLGFLTHWIVNRLSHVAKDDLSELERLAEALHDAEEARDAAMARHRNAEARLSQAEADLRATMEGLHEARREAEELRAWIARNHPDA